MSVQVKNRLQREKAESYLRDLHALFEDFFPQSSRRGVFCSGGDLSVSEVGMDRPKNENHHFIFNVGCIRFFG